MSKIEPISEGNQPGWTLNVGSRSYMVWAPRPERTYEFTYREPLVVKARTQWSAAVSDDNDDLTSNFHRAATLDEALEIFPKRVADEFRTHVKAQGHS